jgi:hypothetical protein
MNNPTENIPRPPAPDGPPARTTPDRRRMLQQRIDTITAEQRVRRAWLDHYDAELAVLALEMEVLDPTDPRRPWSGVER